MRFDSYMTVTKSKVLSRGYSSKSVPIHVSLLPIGADDGTDNVGMIINHSIGHGTAPQFPPFVTHGHKAHRRCTIIRTYYLASPLVISLLRKVETHILLPMFLPCVLISTLRHSRAMNPSKPAHPSPNFVAPHARVPKYPPCGRFE